jgi:hypothetical protein
MFDPGPPETSSANERQHIRQLYKEGHLTPESATVQLLRLDIDAIVSARISPPSLTPPESESLAS